MEQRESMSKGPEVGAASLLKCSKQIIVAVVERERRRGQSMERKQACVK